MLLLLTFFGCPERNQKQTPMNNPVAATPELQNVLEAQIEAMPDYVDLTPATGSISKVLGECSDCYVIEPNVALRTICEGLNCY